LLSRDNNNINGGIGPNNLHRFRGGTRQLYPTGNINRQTSYYSRTTNLTNGQDDKKIPRITSPVSRTKRYGVFGSVGLNEHYQIDLYHLQQNSASQHHRKQQQQPQRPKQMVGTGSSKAQIVVQNYPFFNYEIPRTC
jgi:hypothetical protein